MWLWRARSFIFRAAGPSPGPVCTAPGFHSLPGAFTYPSSRFPLLCKQNQQTTQQSLQHQKIILPGSRRLVLKETLEAQPAGGSVFSALLDSGGRARVMTPCFPRSR